MRRNIHNVTLKAGNGCVAQFAHAGAEVILLDLNTRAVNRILIQQNRLVIVGARHLDYLTRIGSLIRSVWMLNLVPLSMPLCTVALCFFVRRDAMDTKAISFITKFLFLTVCYGAGKCSITGNRT
jgi:hypothetical protein